MNTPLDTILSRGGEAAPAQEAPQEQRAPETPAQSGQQPQERPQSEAKPDGHQPEPQEGAEQEPATVPIAALHAERSKAKRYTEQVASFETQVKQLRDQLSARDRQVSELLSRLPQPQQQPEQDPDQAFFEKPSLTVQQLVRKEIEPLHRQMSGTAEGLSQRFAVMEYGKDNVDAAYGEMERRMAGGDSGALGEYQRIMRSPHPWGELVAWHQEQQLRQEIGSDPAKYREKLKAEILAELQQQHEQPQAHQNGGGQSAPVMPSNLAGARNVGTRAGPQWAGPRKLEDIFNRNRPQR